MSRPQTYVAIVLDRSGSMESIKKETIDNYNEQIQQMKQNAKDQDIFCSLVTFNGEVFEHHWCVPADQLQELDHGTYRPTGATSMRDGLGYTLNKLQSTVQVDENTAFLVIVISDGEENSSKHFDAAKLKSLVAECEATKKWTISYVGCSAASVHRVVAETGIPVANAAVMDFSSGLTAGTGYSNIQVRNSGYYDGRRKGMTSSRNLFSDCESLADFSVSPGESTGHDLSRTISSTPIPATHNSSIDLNKFLGWQTNMPVVGGVTNPRAPENPDAFVNSQPVAWCATSK